MLCMSRAPKINSDDSALQSGGGLNSETVDDEEQDLMNLLNQAGDEMNLDDESDLFSTGDEAETDDALSALLNETENNFDSEQQPASQNEDDSMDELLTLLGNDEETKYQEDQDLGQPLNQPKELTVSEYAETGTQELSSTSQNSSKISDLKDQITTLEQVLSERTNEKSKLEMDLQHYDLQLAELESQGYSPDSYNRSITQTAYSESLPMEDRGTMNSFPNDMGDDFELAYESALQLFDSHRYKNAANKFYQLLQLNRKHSLSDNCQYWLGECYYAQGKYYQAIAEFVKVDAYDAGDKKDDAQMMLGLAFMKLGEVQHAQSELDWLVSAFASSEYVSKAYRYLRRL